MNVSIDDSQVANAKTLIEDHERLFESGDLDAVMKNFAEDIALIAADAPVLNGKEALRDFYASLMEMGKWNFRHDYSSADVAGGCVILHGVAHGKHTPANGDVCFPIANNFLLVVRNIEDRLCIWRAAFMPGASE